MPKLVADKEALVLGLLLQRPGSYGLQLVDASEGALKRGTVYVTLSRMEEKGLVSSKLEDAAPGALGPPRRTYVATSDGVRALRVWEHAAAVLGSKAVRS
jgi:DNA-binding PadR family transcriptional regulator